MNPSSPVFQAVIAASDDSPNYCDIHCAREMLGFMATTFLIAVVILFVWSKIK